VPLVVEGHQALFDDAACADGYCHELRTRYRLPSSECKYGERRNHSGQSGHLQLMMTDHFDHRQQKHLKGGQAGLEESAKGEGFEERAEPCPQPTRWSGGVLQAHPAGSPGQSPPKERFFLYI
jgi:hypothetical protein